MDLSLQMNQTKAVRYVLAMGIFISTHLDFPRIFEMISHGKILARKTNECVVDAFLSTLW